MFSGLRINLKQNFCPWAGEVRLQPARFLETTSRRCTVQMVKTMKIDNNMYLPALSEDEFVENIDKDDFFRRFGNPALIHTKTGERCIVLSAELYDRMAELCGRPSTKEMIKCGASKDDE